MEAIIITNPTLAFYLVSFLYLNVKGVLSCCVSLQSSSEPHQVIMQKNCYLTNISAGVANTQRMYDI